MDQIKDKKDNGTIGVIVLCLCELFVVEQLDISFFCLCGTVGVIVLLPLWNSSSNRSFQVVDSSMWEVHANRQTHVKQVAVLSKGTKILGLLSCVLYI
jgi:hypothetical protein